MSQAQRIQFEQQYNDALNGDKAENKIPDQPFSKIKDSREWTKGSEPMTAAQRSYLLTLMELHGENLPVRHPPRHPDFLCTGNKYQALRQRTGHTVAVGQFFCP